jgi:hypothetical protein
MQTIHSPTSDLSINAQITSARGSHTVVLSAHTTSYKIMHRKLKTLRKIRHTKLVKIKYIWFKSNYGYILYDIME